MTDSQLVFLLVTFEFTGFRILSPDSGCGWMESVIVWRAVLVILLINPDDENKTVKSVVVVCVVSRILLNS